MSTRWATLLTGCLLAILLTSASGGPLLDEDEVTNEVVPLEVLLKRASNLGGRLLDSRNCGAFNMGKKFGGYSWLRSADSTMRRLQYYFGDKWHHTGQDLQEVPDIQKEAYWDN